MVLWLGHGDAYELLGELVTAEYGLADLPPVERDENGKPFFPGAPGLHFNLSHSGGLSLCGAGGAPWGWMWSWCAPGGQAWPSTCSLRRNTPGFNNRGETGGRFIPSGR